MPPMLPLPLMPPPAADYATTFSEGLPQAIAALLIHI